MKKIERKGRRKEKWREKKNGNKRKKMGTIGHWRISEIKDPIRTSNCQGPCVCNDEGKTTRITSSRMPSITNSQMLTALLKRPYSWECLSNPPPQKKGRIHEIFTFMNGRTTKVCLIIRVCNARSIVSVLKSRDPKFTPCNVWTATLCFPRNYIHTRMYDTRMYTTEPNNIIDRTATHTKMLFK